jgi:exodeoxyribonuclease VII small subunit
MGKKPETYSQALEELEETVKNIEENKYDLDALSEAIENTVELITFCKRKLKETDENIEKLLEKIE